MQYKPAIPSLVLCFLLHSAIRAQSVSYSSTVNSDINTKFEVIGKAGNFYWLYKSKKNYTNKILEVSGMVTAISENQRHQPVVLLKTNTDGAAINCTFEGNAGDISTGNAVSIKGICNGIGEGDADLGIMADVYLVRCYVLK